MNSTSSPFPIHRNLLGLALVSLLACGVFIFGSPGTQPVQANGLPQDTPPDWDHYTQAFAPMAVDLADAPAFYASDASGQVLGSMFTWAVPMGDLDGDGDLDAVTAGDGPDRVWTNDGTGSFTDSGQTLGNLQTRAATLGDLDGDGDLDLFVGTTTFNSIWLNDGSGVFTQSQTLTSHNTWGVALGDLDSDGDLDAFVGNNFGETIGEPNEVWLNDGSGTFTSNGQALGGAKTQSVALGDVDIDGDLDVLVGNCCNDPSEIWLNDGNGTFTWSQNLGFYFTRSVALGDLDGDGDLDAFLGNIDVPDLPECAVCHLPKTPTGLPENRVWTNDGSGSFSDSGQSLGTDFSWGIALGDTDGDGDLDVFSANSQPDNLWLNDGSGGFVDSGDTFGSSDARAVSLGDVDGDGDLDALVGNCCNAPDRIWFNAGNSSFVEKNQPQATPPLFQETFETSPLSSWTATGLWHAETETDTCGALMAPFPSFKTAFYYGQVGICTYDTGVGNTGALTTINSIDLTGVSTAELQFHYILQTESASPTSSFDKALVEVSTSGSTGPWVTLAQLPGASSWAPFSVNLSAYAGSTVHLRFLFDSIDDFDNSHFGWLVDDIKITTINTQGVAIGDLNQDGSLDVVAVRDGDNQVWLNSLRSGELSLGQTMSSGDSRAAALGDIDSDGDLDLFVGEDGGSKVWTNNGSAFFTDSGQTLGSGDVRAVALGDLDGDQDLDAVVGSGSDQANTVWWNSGSGTFANSGQALGSGDTRAVALGDLDGDGDLDLFVGNTSGQPNEVWFNAGAGIFTDSGQALGGAHTQAVALGDLDGDGDLDAFNGNNFGPDQVWLNNGSGIFTGSGQVLGSYFTYAAALGDLDQDGDLDAVTGSNFGQANRVWLNNGDGTFRSGGQALGNSNTLAIALGNLDLDSDLDVYFGNSPSQSDEVYLWQSTREQDIQVRLPKTGTPPDANFYATPEILTSQFITIPYALVNPGNAPIGRVEAFYSMDGGGRWLPAVAAPNTTTPASTPPLFQETFETNPLNSWTTAGLWHAEADTDTCGALKDPFPSSNTAFYYGQSGICNFDTGDITSGTLTTIAGVDLTGVSTAVLQFYYVLQTETDSSYDQALVQVSASGPTGPWETLAQLPNAPIWTPFSVNLSAYAGSTVHLRFLFDSVDAGLNSYLGWLVDDIEITVYNWIWDTFESGFFGQSDNVVFRMVAYPQPIPSTPSTYQYTNAIPGPFQWPYAAVTTFPFRVRGTQVRVYSETISAGNELAGGLVYQLPGGQTTGALPMGEGNTPFRTDQNGYLQGRGQLDQGDSLVALVPITYTESYTLYHTSAAPTVNGLDANTVTTPGVQELVVTANNPLLLFNLDVSLEWDARNDPTFLADLKTGIEQASAVLYDVTDGQVALGDVTVYHDRENWLTADIVIYARNNIRPRASQGGVVSSLTDDMGLSGPIPDAFFPGQVSMGPIWDPFGENQFDLGQDWWRTLAHELAHYLLFLPDNYIGINAGGLVGLDCTGSFMTNSTDDSYSEFLNTSGWTGDCLQTVAEQTTGRSDWETVTYFYDMLSGDGGNLGPSVLPLGVTRVHYAEPAEAPDALTTRNYDLRDADDSQIIQAPLAQGYLVKTRGTGNLTDDTLVNLGTSRGGGDRLKVRGASPGDRLCVFDLQSATPQLGCTDITSTSAAVFLADTPNWQPEIQVTPVNSTTLEVSVTLQQAVNNLQVQVYPSTGDPADPDQTVVAPTAAMTTSNNLTFQQTLNLDGPAFNGHVRIWVNGASPVLEAVTEYSLDITAWSGNLRAWAGGNLRAWAGGNLRAWAGGNLRAWAGAPSVSSDGQLTILNLDDPYGDNGVSTMQTVSLLPDQPTWITIVGQAYQVIMQADFTDNPRRSVSFDYLQRDVPDGYEGDLSIYYYPAAGSGWQRLSTSLDQEENRAVALLPAGGEGIYALFATVVLPTFEPGWNLFGYPIPETRSIAAALASVDGAYTAVYHFDPITGSWQLYDPSVPGLYAPLVNNLENLEFGKGYWLYATQQIIGYLGLPTTALRTAAGDSNQIPATYYGRVSSGTGFTPAAGMPVVVKTGNTVCGTTEVVDFNGEWVYKVQVHPNTTTGCGQVGHALSFYVDERLVGTAAAWDNSQATQLHLIANPFQLFLPILDK